MDTALSVDGDFDIYTNGKPYLIGGIDELKQKIYILLTARLGEFIYDRHLGSEIYKIDIYSENAKDEIIAQARKTLSEFPQTEVIDATINNGKITVSVNINDTVCDIQLGIQEEFYGMDL